MQLDETIKERTKQYGLFEGHAALAQSLKGRMRDTPGWCRLMPDQKEALEMVAHKIARILNGNPNIHDSWHDIAGYAQLVADRLKK